MTQWPVETRKLDGRLDPHTPPFLAPQVAAIDYDSTASEHHPRPRH